MTTADLFEGSGGQRYDDTIIGRWRTARRGLRSWLRSEVLTPEWPWDQQAWGFFNSTLEEQMPLKRSELTGISMAVDSERKALLWQTAASASFFAYVTETYETDIHGNELLPALMQGFKEHGSWEEILQAVFGISVEEFEDGWNHWLASQL